MCTPFYHLASPFLWVSKLMKKEYFAQIRVKSLEFALSCMKSMDNTAFKIWTFLLLCARANSLNTTFKCEKLQQDSCYDITLAFNYTTTGIADDSKDQNEIAENLKKWEALSFLPRCWEVLKPLLCGVYMPKCEDGIVELPCRSACSLARSHCQVVEEFERWPEFLKCEKFPLENCDNITVSYFTDISRAVEC